MFYKSTKESSLCANSHAPPLNENYESKKICFKKALNEQTQNQLTSIFINVLVFRNKVVL